MCTGRLFGRSGPVAVKARLPRREFVLIMAHEVIRQSELMTTTGGSYKLAIINKMLWSPVVQHLVHQNSELPEVPEAYSRSHMVRLHPQQRNN